jgi:hypothetical protein
MLLLVSRKESFCIPPRNTPVWLSFFCSIVRFRTNITTNPDSPRILIFEDVHNLFTHLYESFSIPFRFVPNGRLIQQRAIIIIQTPRQPVQKSMGVWSDICSAAVGWQADNPRERQNTPSLDEIG